MVPRFPRVDASARGSRRGSAAFPTLSVAGFARRHRAAGGAPRGHVPSPWRAFSLALAAVVGLSAAVSIVPSGMSASAAVAMQPESIVLETATSSLPAFAHIYLIVLENHELGSIVGNPSAPFINALIGRYGLATNLTAIAHPSQPNYLALFAGSTFGVRDDGVHHITARNLADQLQAHGRSWRVYAQDLPSRCSQLYGWYGPSDLVGLRGWYARKHEPAITFNDIAHSSTRCARITRLSTFSPIAANFELIVPNMTNDMHDGTIAQGDTFLRGFVPRITSSAAFANSLLVITWDEGSSSLGGGGRVATIVVSPKVPRGFRSTVRHTHYSILRTIEDAWGLGCLNQSCTANDLREFFAS